MKISSSKIKQKFTKLKPKVISLRKTGKTYSEIREIYPIPKSTLSDWLRNLRISPKIKQLIRNRAYQKWRAANKVIAKKKSEEALKLRLNIENKAKEEISSITREQLKLLGTALYWAEGNKKDRHHLKFANSDPEMVKVFLKFCRQVCKIPEEKIKARIHLYPGINIQQATHFWSGITGLTKENFYKPQVQVSRASKGKRPRNTLPFGTFHLTAGNTEVTCKVKGWIKGISNCIMRE